MNKEWVINSSAVCKAYWEQNNQSAAIRETHVAEIDCGTKYPETQNIYLTKNNLYYYGRDPTKLSTKRR